MPMKVEDLKERNIPARVTNVGKLPATGVHIEAMVEILAANQASSLSYVGRHAVNDIQTFVSRRPSGHYA